jgi:hypothetical protein
MKMYAKYRITFWSIFKENEHAFSKAELLDLLPRLSGVKEIIRQYKDGSAKDVTDTYIKYCG